jgi:hypothetical protein
MARLTHASSPASQLSSPGGPGSTGSPLSAELPAVVGSSSVSSVPPTSVGSSVGVGSSVVSPGSVFASVASPVVADGAVAAGGGDEAEAQEGVGRGAHGGVPPEVRA